MVHVCFAVCRGAVHHSLSLCLGSLRNLRNPDPLARPGSRVGEYASTSLAARVGAQYFSCVSGLSCFGFGDRQQLLQNTRQAKLSRKLSAMLTGTFLKKHAGKEAIV